MNRALSMGWFAILAFSACDCGPMVRADGGAGGAGGGTAGGAGGGTAGGAGGGTAGGAGGGAASVPLGDYCTAYVAASCDYLVRCGLFDDRQLCQSQQTPCADCLSEARASIDAGRQTYDGQAASRCFEAARTTTACASSFRYSAEPACAPVLTGRVGSGGVCFYDGDCAANSFCDSSAQVCPSTCQPRKPVDGAATRIQECQAGLVASQGKCVQPLPLDADCNGKVCSDGLRCQIVDAGVARCREPLVRGAPCRPFAFADCAGGLECQLGPNGPTCQPRPGKGERCDYTECKYDYLCTRALGDGGNTCELSGSGLPCAILNACPIGLRCVSTPDGGVCQPRLVTGAVCTSSFDCRCGLFCNSPRDGGVCTVPARVGGTCPSANSSGPECLGSECGQGCAGNSRCVAVSDGGGVCLRTACDDPSL